jgi:copper chaperone CopZ
MKKIFLLILLIAGWLITDAQFTKASLKASGLTCSMCSKAVKVALEKVPFVEDVQVDIKSQDYNLTFKEGENVEFDALKEAVEDAGFSVAALKVTGKFNEVELQKDKHVVIGNKNFHFLNTGNQKISGEKTFSIVDKSFVSEKEFKKISNSSKMECVKTGKSGDCCSKDGIGTDARIYHVII